MAQFHQLDFLFLIFDSNAGVIVMQDSRLSEQSKIKNQKSKILLPLPFRSSTALVLFFGVCALGLAVDLFSKVYAFEHLVIEQTTLPNGQILVDSRDLKFIPGLLHFHATTNQGAVFGIGQGKRWLFVVVSIGAIAFLTYLFALSGRQWFYQLLLGMLLAGVLGNMYDRIVYGYVRDMLYALPGWHWSDLLGKPVNPTSWRNNEIFPWIFNIADSLLCVGVFLMLCYSFFTRNDAEDGQQPQLNADERG